jgi:hypothetical protein
VSLGSSGASSPTLLWLQEGGACWDVVSCASNRASFSADDWVHLAPTLGGVFDRSDPLNPFAAWSFVFVAYCSGDWHAGAASDVDVVGVGVQQYRGFETTRRAARMVAGASPSRVVLGGSSAGGVGAALTFGTVAAELAPVHVDVLDDSGPWQGVAPCLWSQWEETFGWTRTVLAGDVAPADFPTLVALETSDYPASRFALVSSWGDRVISSIYGRGQDACTASYPLPPATFGQGLASVAASDPWTFLYPGDCHTALVSSARLDGVPGLAPWLASFVGSP